MALPYKIATLLYCFNERDEVLLLERAQEPNRGFWSPCGGKLKMDIGESPYTCACREAAEELGVKIHPSDLHLTGIVSEHGYQGRTHWLMFLFEVTVKLKSLPPVHVGGNIPILPARGAGRFENSADRPRTNLAVVLAIPRRVFRRALPLPSRRTQRLDAGGNAVNLRLMIYDLRFFCKSRS